MTVRRLVVWVLVLASIGCTSASTAPDGDVVKLDVDHPETSTTSGWLNPKTLQLFTLQTEPEPGDMVVSGLISGSWFTPTSDIERPLHEAPSEGLTRPCWLRLANRTLIYREDGAEPPEPPYLPGRFDPENRLFYPEQRAVVR